MPEREQLLEQYENARFALLMGDFAAEYGEALQSINSALRTEHPEMVSDAALQRSITTIQHAFRLNQRKKRKVRAMKTLKLLPIAVVMAAALLLLASAAFPEFRVGIYNTLRINHKEATEWRVSGIYEESGLTQDDIPLEIEIPENYKIADYYESAASVNLELENSADPSKTIMINIFSGNVSVSVDNEHIVRETQVDVHGHDATLRVLNHGSVDECVMIWTDEFLPGVVLINAVGLDDDALISMARSINYDHLQIKQNIEREE